MTINYGPVCTCGVPQPVWTSHYPCPVHGYRATWPSTTTLGTYRVCRGRHCAHDDKCNRWHYVVNS